MSKPLNFYQSLPNVATSGQPTRSEFHDIADDGYEAVINLAMPDSDNALPDEGSLVASLGMSYINIPVPFDEPTASHLKEFIGILNAFGDRKVWVHCAVNARVSAFMYQYLTIIRGLSPEDATSPLLKKWRPKMDDVWEEFLDITPEEINV